MPVAPPGWQTRIGGDADEVACLGTPEPFWTIGQFYADFAPATDAGVIALLEHAAASPLSARIPRATG